MAGIHLSVTHAAQVRNDKLLYFKNKEDCETGREPIATFRMSQVGYNLFPKGVEMGLGLLLGSR